MGQQTFAFEASEMPTGKKATLAAMASKGGKEPKAPRPPDVCPLGPAPGAMDRLERAITGQYCTAFRVLGHPRARSCPPAVSRIETMPAPALRPLNRRRKV